MTSPAAKKAKVETNHDGPKDGSSNVPPPAKPAPSRAAAEAANTTLLSTRNVAQPTAASPQPAPLQGMPSTEEKSADRTKFDDPLLRYMVL